jgi:renalase
MTGLNGPAPRTVVIGAGMAGLRAAQILDAAGHEVVILDKGRSPGGRMATRRIGHSRVDHGAQFFTVRSPEFAAQVNHWEAAGVVEVWSHGFGLGSQSAPDSDPYPRYIGVGGMTAIPKFMAHNLDVRCGQMAFTIRKIDGQTGSTSWEVTTDDGATLPADHVIVTSPLPQTASLLMESGTPIPDDLWRIGYHRTIGVLVALDGPSALSEHGAVTGADLVSPDLGFVADQQLKGISTAPALLIHASHQWSLQWWEEEAEATTAALLNLAAPYFGPSRPIETQLKKWRLAAPASLWPTAFWVDDSESLYLAGDAFNAGPANVANLEGAFLSGTAAAQHLLAVAHHSDEPFPLE